MTTLAVLLIIGSAVVGPIEAQPTSKTPVPCLNANIPNAHRQPICVYETLPELCERAMREIGIDTKNKSGFLSYGWRDDGGKFVYAFGDWEPIKDARQGWKVRCVPVPEGYKR